MNVKATLTILLLAALSSAAVLLQPEDPFPTNRLYVASADGNRIIEIFVRELPEPVTGLPLPPGTVTGLPLPTFVSGLLLPEDLAFGPDGLLYASDTDANAVFAYEGSGAVAATITAAELVQPTGLAFGPHGGLFVGALGNDTVVQFDRSGSFVRAIGDGSPLDDPSGVAFGPGGHLFVSSYGTDEVLVFDPFGVQVGAVADPALDGPWGLAFGRGGRLYVASSESNRVLAFDKDGNLVETLGNDDLLSMPLDVTVGPDDRVYTTSSGNDLLVRFEPDGTGLILVDPTRDLDEPHGLAFGPSLLDATISGTLARAGTSPTKLQAKALVTVTPGTGILTVLLEDPASELATLFGGHDAMVFHGFDYFEDGSTRRAIHGTLFDVDVEEHLTRGSGELVLDVKGSRFGDEFEATKAVGRLQRSAEGTIVDAAVKAKLVKGTGSGGKKKAK